MRCTKYRGRALRRGSEAHRRPGVSRPVVDGLPAGRDPVAV